MAETVVDLLESVEVEKEKDDAAFGASVVEDRRGFRRKASAIRQAREVIGRVITNTTMLGAAIRATGLVSVDGIVEQLKTRFGRIAEGNIKAFKRAYEECTCEG